MWWASPLRVLAACATIVAMLMLGGSVSAGAAEPSPSPSPEYAPLHWYRIGKVIHAGNSVNLNTAGTLTFTLGGPSVTCTVKDQDTIENPKGGGVGIDTVTSFALSKCKATITTLCPKKTKLGLVAEGLPWSGVLIKGPPTRDDLENVEIALTCTPKSGSPTEEVYEGNLSPQVAPDRLHFGTGSGQLLGPHGAAVTITGEDALEAHAHALITAKEVTAAEFAQDGGEAVAWGRNVVNQLGGGFNTTAGGGEQSPVDVTDVDDVTSMASGLGSAEKGFALALLTNGTVVSWGGDAFGELGNRTLAYEEEEEKEKGCSFNEPQEFAEATEHEESEEEEEGLGEKSHVSELSNVASISAAAAHDLALLNNGTVWAWGENGDGEHGDKRGGSRCETGEPNGVPVQVKGLSEVEAIASGGGANFALVKQGASTDAGEVLAWGRDIEGRLGVGQPSKKQRKEEVKKWEKEEAEKEKGEREHVAEPEWLCPTEIGIQECSKEPRVVSHLPSEVLEAGVTAHITAISAGTTYALALYSNGTIRAWGTNGASQLGTGSKEGKVYEVPAKVKNVGEGAKFGPAVAISAGGGEPGHGLALLVDGKVIGWGSNYAGDLGEPSGETCKSNACIKTPREIPGVEDVISVAAGEGFSLLLNEYNEVFSLGNNKYGRLGTGSTAESSDVPTVITGIGPVSSVDAGEHSAYAVLESGVSAPPPLMTMTPQADALKFSWTFSTVDPKRGIHVCYHEPKGKCPFQSIRLGEKEEAEKSYTFTSLLPEQEYLVSVNNAEKTRTILGKTLP